MTTLRIEVGRRSGTTVWDVLEGLRIAGCMKDVEIDPDPIAFLPIVDLRAALESEGYYVELRPWPDPPPLPFFTRVRYWPRRAYRWARRVVLRERLEDQFLQDVFDSYGNSKAMHDASTRESPMLRMLRGKAPDDPPP